MRFKILFIAFAFIITVNAQNSDSVSADTIKYWKKGGVGSVTFYNHLSVQAGRVGEKTIFRAWY